MTPPRDADRRSGAGLGLGRCGSRRCRPPGPCRSGPRRRRRTAPPRAPPPPRGSPSASGPRARTGPRAAPGWRCPRRARPSSSRSAPGDCRGRGRRRRRCRPRRACGRCRSCWRTASFPSRSPAATSTVPAFSSPSLPRATNGITSTQTAANRPKTMKGRLLIGSETYRLTPTRGALGASPPVPRTHPPQTALLAARPRTADAAAVGDQVDVQLIGVVGVGDREHLVVGALERGAFAETARAAHRPGRRGCRPGSRACRGRRSSRRRRSCARRPGSSTRKAIASSRSASASQSSVGSSVGVGSSRSTCWIRGALLGARPPGRIASSTALHRSVANLDPGRQRRAQPRVGDVSVAVVGVLGEDRAHELCDRSTVRMVDRTAVELAEAIANREHARSARPLPFARWGAARGHPCEG